VFSRRELTPAVRNWGNGTLFGMTHMGVSHR
jgi:hypothetical protein